MEQEKKNILVLSVAQGLSITTTNINMINTGLVGSILATDPSYDPSIVTAISDNSHNFNTCFIINGQNRKKTNVLIGAMAAFIGCLIIAYSIFNKAFFVYSWINFIRFSQANQQFYRYAAADNISTKLKSKAISLVLAGGLIAAIVGPEVSRYSFDFFSRLYIFSNLHMCCFNTNI